MGSEILALQEVVQAQSFGLFDASKAALMLAILSVVLVSALLFGISYFVFRHNSHFFHVTAWLLILASGLVAFHSYYNPSEVHALHSQSIVEACEQIYTGIETGTVQWFHKDVVTLTSKHCDADRLYKLLPTQAAS